VSATIDTAADPAAAAGEMLQATGGYRLAAACVMLAILKAYKELSEDDQHALFDAELAVAADAYAQARAWRPAGQR